MHHPNGSLLHCYLMARDHKAQPCHSGRSKHIQSMHSHMIMCMHTKRRVLVLMDSAVIIFLYCSLTSPILPPSSSSFKRVTAVSVHTHTQIHTLLHGSTFLSVTLSLFSYLFHTDKIQFMTDLWELVCTVYVCASACF